MGKIEKFCAVVGAVFVTGSFYLELAKMLDWWPVPPKSIAGTAAVTSATGFPTMALLGLGLLGVALLITPWVPIIRQRKSLRGFDFAQTRRDLDRKYPSAAARFGEDSSVWAMWSTGTRYFDAAEKLHVIKRLILPNPDSDAARHYFGTIDQDHARPLISATTEKAVGAGVAVRWSDHFPFHALTLIDPVKPSGWAHVEAALPYCVTERRPSYTITRAGMPTAMDTLVHVFERVWQNSSEPRTIAETETAGFPAANVPQIRASLSVSGPRRLKEYIFREQTRWRVKVYNRSPAVAANVQMKLKSSEPEPRDPAWGADYSYPVIPVNSTLDAPPLQINPNSDEDFEITCARKNAGVQFLTTLNTKNPGGNHAIQIQPDERWKLSYEVTAANADPVKFALEMFVESDEVKVVKSN